MGLRLCLRSFQCVFIQIVHICFTDNDVDDDGDVDSVGDDDGDADADVDGGGDATYYACAYYVIFKSTIWLHWASTSSRYHSRVHADVVGDDGFDDDNDDDDDYNDDDDDDNG